MARAGNVAERPHEARHRLLIVRRNDFVDVRLNKSYAWSVQAEKVWRRVHMLRQEHVQTL